MIAQIKTAFRYWGAIPSTLFILIIVSQLMIIGATIWGMLQW